MKKLLLSLLMVCTLASVRAQDNAPYADNTFYLSLEAGATYYLHSGSGSFGVPAAGLYAGRWLMKPLAFQLAAEMVMAPPFKAPDAGNAMYLMGSAQFMWDINSTFFHVYNKAVPYPIPFYPMIGLGTLWQLEGEDYGTDRDLHGMLGIHVPFRIAPKLAAFLELKCYFFPYSFDNSYGANFMPTATVGLTKRWYDSPYGRRTGFETRGLGEDWFTGFGVGVLFNSFEFEFVDNFASKMYNITGDMMVGRNWSDIWTIRFELSGFFGRQRAKEVSSIDPETGNAVTDVQAGRWYTFNSLHTDFMINLSHLANFNRGVKWNFLPYLGAGPVWRYVDPVFTLGADAGIMARRYIDNMGDFFVDLKYIMVPPRLAGGVGPSGSPFGVGYPMLTFGYICNFGHSTTRYRIPVGSDVNCNHSWL